MRFGAFRSEVRGPGFGSRSCRVRSFPGISATMRRLGSEYRVRREERTGYGQGRLEWNRTRRER